MNHLTETVRAAAEQGFAYKLRQALNESANALPADTLERLAAARKAALQAQKPEGKCAEQQVERPVLLGRNGTMAIGSPPKLPKGRVTLLLAALLLVGTGLFSLFHFEQQRQIEELADVDTGVLIDELPISTYTDHGFNAFLKQNP